MNIERADLKAAFHEYAAGGSGVVLGAPGVGKTHLLRAFVTELQHAHDTVPVYLPVDRTPFTSDADLRAELGVEGDVIAGLERLAEDRQAYLVVDALDAARSDQSRSFVLGLISRVERRLAPRWTVLVSVRTYDALRSRDLEELFPSAAESAPASRYQLGSAVCRHFHVPALSDEEVVAAEAELAWLHDLWERAHADLRALLRVPLHLWLLARLFESGLDPSEVSPIRSEVQLLELFWRQRVRSGNLEPDQRLLTRRAAETMMARRTLWAPTAEVYVAGANEAWLSLYSSEVLRDADQGGQRVAFGHNVLFDYATSVELLDENAATLARFLEEEPDRALFLRPTLNYFFARLWFTARDAFWEIFWALIAHEQPHVRLVAQVLPPGLLSQEARQLEDVRPLLAQLEAGAPEAATGVLRVMQAIRTHDVRRDQLWAEFAAHAAEHPSSVFAWDMARFIVEMLDRSDGDGENPVTRESISVAARTLLRWAVGSRDPNLEHLAAVWLVDATARTYAIDPEESRELLSSIVARVGSSDMSIELTYRLADAVEHLFDTAPDLVAELYTAVFSHVETSDERTPMGGIVVALTSNRRQDFEMAQYALTERAPKFIRRQPRVAIPALLSAASQAIQVNEIRPYLEDALPDAEEFLFHGRRAHYIPDRSHFWNASGTIHDDQDKLAVVVRDYLEELPVGDRTLMEAVDLIAEHAVLAFFWRKLLQWGAGDPGRYASALQDLLLAEPVLTNPETAPEAASFLRAAEPLLSDEFLAEIEATINRLAERGDDRARHWCRRLIARIPEHRVQTQAGRAMHAEALEDDAARSNRPLVSFSTFTEPFDSDEWLREEGVEIDEPANRRVLSTTQSLEQFASKYVNEDSVPADATRAAVGEIDVAMSVLEDSGDLPAPLIDTAWARIGDAAGVASRAAELSDEEFTTLRRALLACARGEAPRVSPEGEDTFNFPGWSPAARNEAAQGIPRLIAQAGDDELTDALRALAVDPVPSVRFLVARELPRITTHHEDLFWELVALCADRESNHLVQQALAVALTAAASPERESRVTEIFERLLTRTSLAEMGTRLPGEDQAGVLLVGLAVARENEWAVSTLKGTIDDVPSSYLSTLVLHLLEHVSFERLGSDLGRQNLERALSWLPRVIDRVKADLLQEVEKPIEERDTEKIDSLFAVTDQIVSRFYFSSGVYRSEKRRVASSEEICQFFGYIQPHLRRIAELAGGERGVGLPPRTAHHFIELLRGSLPCEPAEVLHLTRLAVDAALGAGYAFDPMAAREVTAIIETTLADHREAARATGSLSDLMTVLDAFVEAGWPEAQRLVWRLEELFR